MESGTGSSAPKRTSTACEACRASKLRCQPSEQPGVCRKCLESKRECVSRTGPRTRRSRKAKLIPDGPQQQTSPAAGPSSTFSIDFEVPAPPEVDENFQTLRDNHTSAMNSLFPDDIDDGSPSMMAGIPTPPSSTAHSHSIQDLHTKPQFNRASAESLLTSFSAMLAHCPCIVLPEDVTVSQLAATKPFVLLAILAAASGSRTLQGHMLYDEEFRKVLGLKVVAGGERSLELLQGIVIYCAWYPFHLRPKNKQMYHYLRMASDLVSDLELDQEPAPGDMPFGLEDIDSQLEATRAYLGFYYLCSRAALSWSTYKSLIQDYTPWITTCCDALQSNAICNGDIILATLVRLSGNGGETWEAVNTPKGQSVQQIRLLLLGLESQLQSLQQVIPAHIASKIPVRFCSLFGEMFIHCAPLGKHPRKARGSSAADDPLLETSRLVNGVAAVKRFLDFFIEMDKAVFTQFISVEWAKFVMGIILALQLAFPLKQCPGWDSAWARSQLQLEYFFDEICKDDDLTSATKKVDVLSATRVVLRVVKQKYIRRLAVQETAEMMDTGAAISCPMLDGSMDSYLPLWQADVRPMPMMPSPSPSTLQGTQPIFHDLWATMTMGWANDEAMFPVEEGSGSFS